LSNPPQPEIDFTNILQAAFCQNSFTKKIQSQTVSSAKLQKQKTLFLKCKMLVRFTPEVDFTIMNFFKASKTTFALDDVFWAHEYGVF